LSEPPNPPPPHVLYIDDDAALCRLVSRSLERRGFKVTAVQDPLQGVEMAVGDGYDVIAVDHYMPSQTGLETLRPKRRWSM